ncbi:hypothetical protein KAU55_00535 [Candidatus Bathyarchaeota archaeon]|nr:hypothetical protein [Candidatus Bathyarchaeota archaeon]
MKRTLTMLERVFLPEPELERKPGYYRLDYGTMTQPEKDTVKEALEQNEQISLEAMKEQKVTRRFDVDYSNVKITQDQHSLLVMADAVFQKHAVSPKEYSRRYPIH